MSPRREIQVGVIGLGLMGRTHIEAYRAANGAGRRCRLIAVCDRDERRLSGRLASEGNVVPSRGERLFDPREVRATTDAEHLLADPEIDLVSICTHTDSHVELAVRALKEGKHVLVEKPLAVAARDAARVVRAAGRAKTALCMTALCMRFWPGWSWLKRAIRSGRYGAVRSAVFQRRASPPSWATSFYRDDARTGGALVDLHLHDADFVRWCFGDPDAVVSTGTADHVTTLYRYARGPAHVVAEGGWDHASGYPFAMRYTVVFERATADFDLGRAERLKLYRGGRDEAVPIEQGTGYEREIAHLLAAIAAGRGQIDATAEDGWAVARLLEAERRSLRAGRPVRLR